MNLHLGRWQDVLADVTCDAVITDPPYGGRTHMGHNDAAASTVAFTGEATRTNLAYHHWTPDDVREFVASWAPRCRGWLCAMTSHDLVPAYEAALGAFGRFTFAPLPIIQKRPRLVGDGPSSWTVYLVVSRPRGAPFSTWGCLPGAYFSHTEQNSAVAGAKPLSLMRSIVRDYSRPGDLVCDPCAGGGTTLLAALTEGRRAVGAELDPITHAAAQIRLDRGYTPLLPGMI